MKVQEKFDVNILGYKSVWNYWNYFWTHFDDLILFFNLNSWLFCIILDNILFA